MPRTNDDPRVTAKVRHIRLHYKRMADQLDWTPARYRRLAGVLRFTIYELGAYLRIPPHLVEKYLLQRKFPATVELHLSMIERTLLAGFESEPLFPNPQCSSTTTS